MTVPTHRDSDRFMLRLPDGMRDEIKAAAEANNRSMNAEIISRLVSSFTASDVGLPTEFVEMVRGLHALLSKDPRIAKELADHVYRDEKDRA